jgi:uncharacterized membrane protein YeaQ/YmgE (transglycosylase-associated protein family)
MRVLADIPLYPGGVIAWLVVGLLAGWLAGKVMSGAGYGILGDILVGLIGAVVGGFLFGLIAGVEAGFWGSVVIAFLGACVLIVVVHYVALRRTRL